MLWRTECADMVVLLAISRFLLALIVAFFATIFRGASLQAQNYARRRIFRDLHLMFYLAPSFDF